LEITFPLQVQEKYTSILPNMGMGKKRKCVIREC